MSHSSPTRQRGSDLITRLAVGLFVAVVVLELMLATWLPRRLRTERLWGREMAVQELIDQVDWLRSHIRSLKDLDRWRRGEVDLALVCVDDIARHLRDYQNQLTREQIRQLQSDVTFFEHSYLRWKKARSSHLTLEQLATDAWLEREQQRLAVAAEGAP